MIGVQFVLFNKIAHQIHPWLISDRKIQAFVGYQTLANGGCGVNSVEMGICLRADRFEVEAVVDVVGFLYGAVGFGKSYICRNQMR